MVNAERAKQVAELEAAQRLNVSELDTKAAAQEKLAKILRAEGEAEKAKKLLQADGALDRKLTALVAINRAWANAYTKQRPTPDVVMGANGTSHANPAQTMMTVLTTKALKDLQTNLKVGN